MRLRQEWARENINPLFQTLSNQIQSYSIFGVQYWYTILAEGKSVRGFSSQVNISEQTLLHRDGISSYLMVPIRLGRLCSLS